MARKTKPKKSAKTAKRKAKKQRKPSAATIRERLIAAMLDQAASEGWRTVTLQSISTAAKIPLSTVCEAFPSKQAILHAFLDDIDETVCAGTNPADQGEAPRDRLFDVLMRRFDVLEPHKQAIANILRDMPGDPIAGICGLNRFGKSMAVMLDAAHLSSPGLMGILKTKGLSLVYLNTVRVWLRDETPDLSKTMAALDKNLQRADQAAAMIFNR
ncbi:MAG: hypothetical protein ACO3MW_06205 [Rhodospirillales bacterium]